MMKRSDLPQARDHRQFCVIRNKRLALLALLTSVAMLMASFRELYRPIMRVRMPVSVILVLVYMIGVMALSIVRVRCSHERLWLGIAVTGVTVLFVRGWFPVLVAHEIKVIRILDLLLWSGATLVSIWFVRSAFRSPARGVSPPGSSPEQGRQ
jgi:hypothetical protein